MLIKSLINFNKLSAPQVFRKALHGGRGAFLGGKRAAKAINKWNWGEIQDSCGGTAGGLQIVSEKKTQITLSSVLPCLKQELGAILGIPGQEFGNLCTHFHVGWAGCSYDPLPAMASFTSGPPAHLVSFYSYTAKSLDFYPQSHRDKFFKPKYWCLYTHAPLSYKKQTTRCISAGVCVFNCASYGEV